jgi:hypothetical protein
MVIGGDVTGHARRGILKSANGRARATNADDVTVPKRDDFRPK